MTAFAYAGDLVAKFGKIGIKGEAGYGASTFGFMSTASTRRADDLTTEATPVLNIWGQASYPLSPKATINLGGGTEDPHWGNFPTAGFVEKNLTFFGNVMWAQYPFLNWSLEVERISTEYIGIPNTTFDVNVITLSSQLKF